MRHVCLILYSIFTLITYSFQAYRTTTIKSFQEAEIRLPDREMIYKIFKYTIEGFSELAKADLVIRFGNGKGYSTRVAIYDDLNAIKQNEQKEFIDFVWGFKVNMNEYIIRLDDEKFKGPGPYFIAVYDTMMSYQEYLTVFYEAETRLIQSNCYSFSRLYSSNSIKMSYLNGANTYLAVGYKSDIKDASLELRITEKETTTIALTEGFANFTFEKDTQVQIELISTREKYALINATVCFDIQEAAFTELKGKIKPIKRVIHSQHFLFKMKLNNPDDKVSDESAITLVFDYPSPVVNLYCSMSMDTKSDSELLKDLTSNVKNNECAFTRDEIYDSAYQIYFKKTLNRNMFIFKVELTAPSLRKPIALNVIPYKKIEAVTQFNKKPLFDYSTHHFFLVNSTDFPNQNLIIYTDFPAILSIFEDTLSLNTVPTRPISFNQMYFFKKSSEEKLHYLKVVNPYYTVYIFAEKVNEEVISFSSKKRLQESFVFTPYNCSASTFIIREYKEPSADLFNIELLFGDIDAFYLEEYGFQNKLPEMMKALKQKKVTQSFRVKGAVDLFLLQCKSPSLFNIEVGTQELKSSIAKGDHFISFLAQGQVLEYLFRGGDEDFGFEVKITEDNSTLDVYVDNFKEKSLNKNEKKFQKLLIKERMASIKLISTSETGSYVSLSLGSNSLYQKIEGNDIEAQVTNQNLLYFLEKSDLYYKITIQVTIATKQSVKACISQRFGSYSYVPLFKDNCANFTSSLSIQTLNPYTKYQSLKEENSMYYLTIYLEELIKDKMTTKITYAIKNTQILKEGHKEMIMTQLSKVYLIGKSEDAEKVLVLSINNCNKSYFQYVNTLNDVPFYTVTMPQLNNFPKLTNYLTETDIVFNEGVVLLSYDYTLKKDFVTESENWNYDTEATSWGKWINLTLNYLDLQTTRYDIYVNQVSLLNETVEPCSLFDKAPTYFITKEPEKDKKAGSLEFYVNSTGYYTINVFAYQLEGMKVRVLFRSVNVKVQSYVSLYAFIGVVLGLIALGIAGYFLCKRRKLRMSLDEHGDLLNNNSG